MANRKHKTFVFLSQCIRSSTRCTSPSLRTETPAFGGFELGLAKGLHSSFATGSSGVAHGPGNKNRGLGLTRQDIGLCLVRYMVWCMVRYSKIMLSRLRQRLGRLDIDRHHLGWGRHRRLYDFRPDSRNAAVVHGTRIAVLVEVGIDKFAVGTGPHLT